MKTLIQKDLRENLKIALLGLLIFSLLLLQAYQSCISSSANLAAGRWSGQTDSLQPLLASNLLTDASFFCILFGAILGWLQTRNEAHRDLWAFLIHRPVTRAEIFWSKTMAGLCLYIFGAGLPLLILVLVVRMPGHVAAPFEWAMVLPLVSIFLSGFAYYFAGLLTGLRQARWYGSRIFGLGLAIVGSIGIFGGPGVWMLLVMIGVAVAILAIAVWGAYLSGGFYRGQPLAGRFALTVAMTAGSGVVLFAGAGLIVGLVLDQLSPRTNISSSYLMTRDGVLYKTTSRDGQEVDVVDLNGHAPLDPKTGQKIEIKEFRKRTAYSGWVFSTFKKRNQNWNAMHDSMRFFSLLNVTDKTLWYLDRHGKVLGYDGRTRKYAGSLDPRGASGMSSPESLLRPANYYYYNAYNDAPRKLFPSAKTVYQVDFKERTVQPVFTLTNDDEIGGYGDVPAAYDGNQPPNFMITTRRTIRVMDFEGHPILALPYEPSYSEYPQVDLTLLQPTNGLRDDFAIWFYPDPETNRARSWAMPIHVVWLGPDHTLTKSADLPPLPRLNNTSWGQKLAEALLPPVAHFDLSQKNNGDWTALNLALALISAGIGLALVRRYNFSIAAMAGWTAFIFVLGIAGLLGFLCVQEWPVREVCVQCKKFRVVDHPFCEHCQAPFPPPEKDGTEIFAPLVKS